MSAPDPPSAAPVPASLGEGAATVGFGGGCHWCTEAVFQSIRGVECVEQGWISSAPPHEAESEAVRVGFRTDEIDLDTLIAIHLATHASRSDHSMRSKYRSAVYTTSPEQHERAARRLRELDAALGGVVTEAMPLVGFRLNTPELLDYYRTRPDAPFCTTYIDPKLAALRATHAAHLRPAVGERAASDASVGS